MAATCEFLTCPWQRDLSIASATSEATGHPIEHAFDQNLTTYWSASSTASQSIVIDLQTAQTVNGLAVWFHDYGMDYGGGALFFYVETSDVGTSGPWDVATGMSFLVSDYFTQGKPLAVGPRATGLSKRYWRIRSIFAGWTLQVAQFYLFRQRSIAVPDAFPHDDRRIYAQNRITGPGGRLLRSPINRIPVHERQRTWLMSDADDIAALQGAVQDCAGQNIQAIYLPSDGDPEVIEFIDQRFRPNQLIAGIYKPTVRWRTVPYIADGDLY